MMAVAACCAADGRAWEQDCKQCHDPIKRAAWGCDEPTKVSTFELSPCMFCSGRSDDCTHCKGTNRIEFFRCPNKMVTPRHVHAVRAAAHVEAGILPDAGDWNDQAHTFVVAYPWIARELQWWREKLAEDAARKHEQQKRRR